ncbi:putative microtubule associated protein (Ase1) [Aspergillus clavatus NRRL 1]|uniref:Microtubule associated protein (Ase1), putative n=1 Tax=Aspergillus clavatus (strain ATCC 1007 / CBS 513.65 / DSM 816 / NCTC 3887 / NRRL 1 / QM 1276 / 107) TaxID=344612 RepID=A1C7W3_ASPCL|nr:microtubule associated protein (Ase1), putative [Aspergillus clavatus NRRL 1]EAW14484.1 microtubule associated protein (Ase1), putative [Aspergillus clavatus NRRL 1]
MAVDTSYLTTQVNNIVSQLHGIFDDIGVPSHERETREAELFSALSETLNNHLKIVDDERTNMTEEGQRLVTAIRQMEESLVDEKANGKYHLDQNDLRVTYPLNRCLSFLRDKHGAMKKLHQERFEQVKKLVEALESYSSHLESTFVSIELPPTAPGSSIAPSFDLSPSYVAALDNEFTRVYEEYHRRVDFVKSTCEEIIKLWAELGTPQVQTDAAIVKYYRESPEQLGLHESDLANLMTKREKLLEEKKTRERKLKELRAAVESLWERFGVEDGDRKAFLAANRGCGLRTINEFEEELGRLNELKRQNLHLFVEDARCRLQELWDGLYFSEEEMLDFTPAFSDVYSDALLEAHEAEIARLEALTEQRAPTLQLIARHKSLLSEREALAISSQDASRLMARGNKGERRDPGKLLREEKMRKRIAKELPKVEADLRKELERWEEEFGRPFLVQGERYLDELTPVTAKPPPRSKTPSVPPSVSAKASFGKSQPPSRPASVMRGPPPPRSATKTPTGNFPTKYNTIGPSRAGARSPSKIPARVPLSNMPYGNNSNDRRAAPGSYSTSTISGKIPSSRPPPPRMRALTVESKEARGSYLMDPPRSASALSNAFVRPVSPEDVYDDRNQRSFMSSSIFSQRSTGFSQSSQSSASSISLNSSLQSFPRPNPYMQHAPPPPPPAPRQVSNSSTVDTAITGSENWETFDDGSDSEVDASDVYYAKLRAAHNKRFAPEENSSLAGKKAKGIRSVSPDEPMDNQHGQMVRVAGSDAGWTDDMEPY